ncbi:MAG: hypothetical protein U5L96_11250 [Owenweeksia sp.]|nr:hypothetical protein [Owenweeksia sp.]
MFARKERLEKLALLGKTNTRYYVEQTAADLAKAYYQLKQERIAGQLSQDTGGIERPPQPPKKSREEAPPPLLMCNGPR